MSGKSFFSSLWHNKSVRFVLAPWAALFILLNLANTQDGGPNAVSRFLTLRAMSEEATFTIDKRIGASDDWARTPDGHYYSNKGPGPMLLGFPAFFVIDQIPRLWEKGYRDEHGHRHTPGYFQKTWTSFLNQIVPLILLLAFIIIWMEKIQLDRSLQIYFLLACFFGSTASMYFNNYSGHGFEAIMQLGALFSLLTGNFAWSGFFAGSALLSDYGFGIQIPAYILTALLSMRHHRSFKKSILSILIGGIIPGALWIWYHTAAFGSPFAIANHFQNPIFQDTLNEKVNLWGIFRIPDFKVLMELLVGQSRGLLFTQPWILFLFPMAAAYIFLHKKSKTAQKNPDLFFYRKASAIFCGLSLVGLLFVNMSYGGWNGGGAAGPRYLSGIFLCFALWMTLEMQEFPRWLRVGFWALLAISILFRALVYGSTILGPSDPLWNWYIGEFFKKSKTPHLRFAIFVLFFALTLWWQRRLWKKNAITT